VAFATLDMPFNKSVSDVWGLVDGLRRDDVDFMPLYHLQGMEARWICFANSGDEALSTLQTIRQKLA